MYEFIDKTSLADGTALNRKTLMAVQGFIATTTAFNSDGSIVMTNGDGHTLTVSTNSNGDIVEVFKGEKTITKTTTFNNDGTIKEVIS